MLFVLVQKRDITHIVNGPINAHTNKAFASYTGKNVFVLAFFAANQGSANLDFRTYRPSKYRLYYLRRVLACNLFAAHPAVRLTHTGKKQSEIIVNFSSGSHRRARIAAGTSLLNCNSRRQTCNVCHCRFLHLFEELPSISTQ
ncbi:hypothetical protein ES703_88996 [subsurface metagenome]